ncbi:hypothetical protein FDF12_11565 [Clostridium botulinum]|nr:hypothetical protein [Clostridium botulinum]NFS54962.1 hypothetical protein [Clostridium botulinum]NFT17993.1 hypothetical protein [Clostridium botulinum]
MEILFSSIMGSIFVLVIILLCLKLLFQFPANKALKGVYLAHNERASVMEELLLGKLPKSKLFEYTLGITKGYDYVITAVGLILFPKLQVKLFNKKGNTFNYMHIHYNMRLVDLKDSIVTNFNSKIDEDSNNENLEVLNSIMSDLCDEYGFDMKKIIVQIDTEKKCLSIDSGYDDTFEIYY